MEEGQVAEQPDVAILSRLSKAIGEPVETEETETPEQPEQAEEPEKPEAPEKPEEQEDDGIAIDPEVPFMDITVKLEGGGEETRKWSLNEMRAGVMMQADYQRKTAELSKAREQLQQEVVKSVEPIQKQYAQNLQFMQAVVQGLILPELQGVDLEKIASENPAEYVKLNAKHQRAQQALSHIAQQMQQVQQQQIQQVAEHSRRILADPVQGIPGWGDSLYNTIVSEGVKQYGFTQEEVANVVDYRMIKVLNDAIQYRRLQQANPAVSKKVTAAPKVMKPGAANTSDAQAQHVDALSKAHKKAGTVDSAASLYMARQRRSK